MEPGKRNGRRALVCPNCGGWIPDPDWNAVDAANERASRAEDVPWDTGKQPSEAERLNEGLSGPDSDRDWEDE